jgi:iron complex outermembrane receptor protein
MTRRSVLATFAALSILLLPAPLLAQEATVVSGVVTTAADGLPVPGATVSIEALGLSAVTDEEGRYTLTVPADVAKGQKVEIKVTSAALRPRIAQVTLSPGSVSEDFALGLGFHEEVTVGSRATGTEAEKAVPVDILTQAQIQSIGAAETMQVIQALAPSFNFPRPTIADGTDSIRPATLRGLGPDHVLVLINGKRRHTTALIHINGTIGRGATGVDLNAIPLAAIERIEILRDGAAAQYGSDAIAGVINIVLKSGAQPLTVSARAGFNKGSFTEIIGTERDFSDGGTGDVGANYGWGVGRGTVTLTAEFRNREGTNRAGADQRDQVIAGDANNNVVPQPNMHWGDSEEKDFMTFLNGQVPLNSSETTFAYGFGGWSRRTGSHGGNYRRGIDANNWKQIYPIGFLPLIEPRIIDASGTLGVRGARGEWFWDLSAQYGHNRLDYDVANSLNASLGPEVPPNHFDFYAGGLAFNQIVTNLDLSRKVNMGLANPVNVAFGAEARFENYQIFAGEPDSWRDGGSLNQFGTGPAVPGAQVFPGFRPKNELDEWRHNLAAYLDVEGDVFEKLRVGLAGRVEDYSDFGSTVDGKVTVRVQPHKRFVIRGAASTGFRAPSLGQEFFSTVSTNFTLVGGTFVPLEVVTAPVADPLARQLGAKDLKPEQSVNLSAGVVWNPIDALDLTVDLYRVRIDDRIVLSGNFTGGGLASLLREFGAGSARYFTNAVDTKTKGIDVIANYHDSLGSAGDLRLQVAYNKTDTDLLRIAPTPPELAQILNQTQFTNILFNDTEVRRFTCGQPEDNLRLVADWRKSSWGGTVRQSRYGDYCSIEDRTSDGIAQDFSADWVTDVELAYSRPRFTIALGSQNVFNNFPDKNILATSFSNSRTFARNAPFGYNGRYLYARLVYRF